MPKIEKYITPAIYKVIIKKGMKFKLAASQYSSYPLGAKAGDIVKVTQVTSVFRGVPSDGSYSDYELIRVSNGKGSWRISREDLVAL